jgi:parvulin-like peptidyl-prolyl isomerase
MHCNHSRPAWKTIVLGLIAMSVLGCNESAQAPVNALPPAGLAGAGSETLPQPNEPARITDGDLPRKDSASSRAPETEVLRVNEVALTQADLERAMLHQAAALGIPFRGLPEKVRMRLEVPAYEGLIKRELLRQAAAKDRIVVSPEEIQAEKSRLVQRLPPGRTFAELLQGMMTNEESFLRDLSTDMAIAKWMKQRTQEAPIVDETAARRLYEEQKERFAANEKASARHILVAVSPETTVQGLQEARDRAIALRARVDGKDEQTFAEVAATQSDDMKTREKGGDLGAFGRNEVLPQIGDVAFALASGEVSEIVRSDKGFHILRGGGVTRGAPLPFEEVKERIILIAQTEARAKYEASLFQELEQAAKVVRYIEPVVADATQPAKRLDAVPASSEKGMPHGLPLPSKQNVLPGMRNPHKISGDELRLSPKDKRNGLRVSPSDFQR